MSLKEEISKAKMSIKTDHYPMSIGEWASMYRLGELDIHPEFQRVFRWSDEQKTNLIESLLLGIPIPPIFVSQREDGVWDVIDGVQRLSTIFQFMGILKDVNSNLVLPLQLKPTKYIPSFNEWSWTLSEDEVSEDKRNLFNSLQLTVKRSKLNVSIVLCESSKNTKFDLFQRLNTGGSELSDQEVRNCILVMLNRRMHGWLQQLASYESFQNVLALSEPSLLQKYDMDLALRFLIFINMTEEGLSNIGDINIFLTEEMRRIATDESYDFESAERVFKRTFDLIAEIFPDGAFKRYDANSDSFKGGFLISVFEVVACGLGHNVSHETEDFTLEKVKSLFANETYTRRAGSGVRANMRLPRLIPFGRALFSNEG